MNDRTPSFRIAAVADVSFNRRRTWWRHPSSSLVRPFRWRRSTPFVRNILGGVCAIPRNDKPRGHGRSVTLLFRPRASTIDGQNPMESKRNARGPTAEPEAASVCDLCVCLVTKNVTVSVVRPSQVKRAGEPPLHRARENSLNQKVPLQFSAACSSNAVPLGGSSGPATQRDVGPPSSTFFSGLFFFFSFGLSAPPSASQVSTTVSLQVVAGSPPRQHRVDTYRHNTINSRRRETDEIPPPPKKKQKTRRRQFMRSDLMAAAIEKRQKTSGSSEGVEGAVGRDQIVDPSSCSVKRTTTVAYCGWKIAIGPLGRTASAPAST